MSTKFIPFKPFKYEFAYHACVKQTELHWSPFEIHLLTDKQHFDKLDDENKELILSVFSFFTQSDIEVNDSYGSSQFMEFFEDRTEINFMLSIFGATEVLHSIAYAHLIETLNIDHKIYSSFLLDKHLSERYELIQLAKKGDLMQLVFFNHIYLEGVSLFGMFALLLNYNRQNKFRGMGQIITWSMRDETLHVANMCNLISEYIVEKGNHIEAIQQITTLMYDCLVREIDYIVSIIPTSFDGSLVNDMKQYLGHLGYVRIKQLITSISFIAQSRNKFIDPEPLINIMFSNFMSKMYLLLPNVDFTKAPQWIIDLAGAENVNYFVTTNTSYSKMKAPTVRDFSKFKLD